MPCVLFPPRFIGPVFIDVVLTEAAEASMEIPTHPVEKGAKISDHAWRLPRELKMECLNQDMVGAWGSLYDLMKKAEPFDVLSGFDLFPNMMIESIEPKRDITYSNILFHTVTLKEVIIVSSGGGIGGGLGSLGSLGGIGGDLRGLASFARGQVQALGLGSGSGIGAIATSQIARLAA